MARAFLHRLIAYVFLIYFLVEPATSINSFPHIDTLLDSLSPLPYDQIPIGEMAYPQTGYRSVGYFVVSYRIFIQTLHKDLGIHNTFVAQCSMNKTSPDMNAELGHLWQKLPTARSPGRQAHPCLVRVCQRSP